VIRTVMYYCRASASANMNSAILEHRFCPTVPDVMLVYLNKCTYRQTFPPSCRVITLVFPILH